MRAAKAAGGLEVLHIVHQLKRLSGVSLRSRRVQNCSRDGASKVMVMKGGGAVRFRKQ